VDQKNIELMREKIVLNGRIAELTALLDDALNANKIYSDQIQHDDHKLTNLFKVLTESPVKKVNDESTGKEFFTIS